MKALLISFLGAAAICSAATTFNVTFAPDTLSGSPGDVIPLSGTLLNNTGNTVFINSDSFTFAIAGAVSDTPFLTNAPISLAGNASSGPFIFLNVTIPVVQGAGTYDGVFTVLGGPDANALTNLGASAFHLTVNVVTPESGSNLLVGLGLAALLFWRYIANSGRHTT